MKNEGTHPRQMDKFFNFDEQNAEYTVRYWEESEITREGELLEEAPCWKEVEEAKSAILTDKERIVSSLKLAFNQEKERVGVLQQEVEQLEASLTMQQGAGKTRLEQLHEAQDSIRHTEHALEQERAAREKAKHEHAEVVTKLEHQWSRHEAGTSAAPSGSCITLVSM